MKWLIACLLYLSVVLAYADEPQAPPAPPPVRVRVHQEPVGTLMQGETARIVVDVLTSDFFIDAPVLPELHIDGAYLSLSAETPGHLVETVDGQSWPGVSRTYLITPLMSGPIDIPSFEITAHLGAQRTPVAVQTQPLSLEVRALVLPAGVTEALIARSLKITQTITPEDGGLHVGDTLTRRIEISAEGAPAMMLPPSTFAPVDGLTLYPASPVVRDAVDNHGGFVGGTRVDTASYVIDHRGRYTLPPISVRWMDSRTHEWREHRASCAFPCMVGSGEQAAICVTAAWFHATADRLVLQRCRTGRVDACRAGGAWLVFPCMVREAMAAVERLAIPLAPS